MIYVIIIHIVILFPIVSKGQFMKEILVDPTDNGKVLSVFLQHLERKHGVDFICDEEGMRALTLTGISEKQRFFDFLDDHFKQLQVFKYNDSTIFIFDKNIGEKYALKRENFVLLPMERDTSVELRGNVIDDVNKSFLIGAKITLPGRGTLASTDENGQFILDVPGGNIIAVDVEYVGYEPNRYVVGFSDQSVTHELLIALLPESTELESVTITADRVDQNVTAMITGVENLSIAAMKSLPSFLGEVDPIRSLTTLPGVSTVGELASGFNVRGGESGQNLVLQDGAIIYNPSHLFGFFSAFNPDMVSNVTLYKGGGPATFGSRISSVLDVALRNGDAGKHSVSGAVGLISSRLSLEGPILKNKSSYLVGGRISYCNWLVQGTDNITLKNSSAHFGDVTGKFFHTFNESNYLSLSIYHSVDDFKIATDSVFSWNTTNFSLKWDHTFSPRVSSTLTLVNSNYFSEVHSISEIEGYKYHNSIRNVGLKYDVTKIVSESVKVASGLEMTGTLLEPGRLTPDDQFDNVVPQDMENQHSVESAIYLQWDTQLSEKWSVAAGLRYSNFHRLGAENVFSFNYNDIQGRYPAIVDTIAYHHGKVIKRYSGLEPRLSLNYMTTNQSSVKASYYRGYQYLHLISNTSSTTPQDYWITSGPYLKPQLGDQYSLGFFQNLENNRYEISVEGFYKEIENAVDYIEGADITLNPALEAGLSQGHGLAYGAEVLLKKSTGRMNGWLSYTYSRSLRRFAQEDRAIMINHGRYYPSAFDQPHHLSLILNYQLGGRIFLSANFNYSSGRPITIPISKFSYDVYLSVLNYSNRNEFRIPDYHRLDLAMTIKDKPRNNKRLRSEWVISFFNVYSRKNTYSISFDRYGKASKLAVLGSIFPSINYNFKF